MVIDEDSKLELVPNAGSKARSARRLDLVLWQVAWDRFALAAAMLNMLPYRAAMQHKQVVLEIAVSCADDHKPVLAVVYDEMVRKEWENKAGLLGDAFKVADKTAVEDEVVLKRAKRDKETWSDRVSSGSNRAAPGWKDQQAWSKGGVSESSRGEPFVSRKRGMVFHSAD